MSSLAPVVPIEPIVQALVQARRSGQPTHTCPFQAGDVITAGAWALTTAHAGDLVEASFDGVGPCRLDLG
jgi:2-keto-4-pentenoate hydratase